MWTSATRRTAKDLIRILFPKKISDRLVFVWSRNFCDLVANTDLDARTVSEGSDDKSPKAVADSNVSSDSEERKRRKTNDGAASKVSNTSFAGEDEPKRGQDAGHLQGQNGGQQQHEGQGGGDNEKVDEFGRIVRPSDRNRALPHKDVTAVKSMSKVWSSYPLWDATNTILLDDSPEKCPSQFRGNALHPPPLCGTITTTIATAGVDENTIELPEESAGTGDADGSGEEKKPDEDATPSIVDNDEVNQNTQRKFFRLLSKHWSKSPPKGNLISFLEEHAKAHKMEWDMSS